ncbi:DAK2 domain-containing protein [Skermania piniformis]|uniref:DAK2 domain-containing protein n=1 Tax=Skermania pinensis TaxID=39122 RepID=A0ABX8S652_9ACTN|nr:DAK2 domain-containing protein [Skermania piniformis]QXQ12726.1 DAK2 domain-containing protein [Skermania piniformis]
MLDQLDGAAIARWGRAGLAELTRQRAEIDRLNVFPVADADTGTNLMFTMQSAMHAVDRLPAADAECAGAVSAAMAAGATHGARGNSGIILAQVLRGIAEVARAGPLTAATLGQALERAAVLARRAVGAPVEGTVVTVLAAAAAAGSDTAAGADTAGSGGASLARVADAAAGAATLALRRTPTQLPLLAAAGVVDAGARGLVVLLDALVAVVAGAVPDRPSADPAVVPAAVASAEPAPLELPPAGEYEVMFRVADTDETRIDRLRDRLARLGSSVTVGGDGAGDWSVHVHCADAGAAVEAGVAAGRIHRVRITGLAGVAVSGAEAALPPADPTSGRGILALVAGSGAADLFTAEGATVLRVDQPIAGADLLAAIRSMPHREVVVLPNGALPAQELVAIGVAARDGRREVLLLPSAATVQGLAALAVHDPARAVVDDVFTMSEAAAGTRWAALRIATERALTMVGECAPGDGLGLIGPEVVVITADAFSAGAALIDRMLGTGGELLTLLTGADAPADLVTRLSTHVAARHPGVDVVRYSGGQVGDLIQLGVE